MRACHNIEFWQTSFAGQPTPGLTLAAKMALELLLLNRFQPANKQKCVDKGPWPTTTTDLSCFFFRAGNRTLFSVEAVDNALLQ